MLTKVTKLEKVGGFRLRVRFTDGSEGVHDFAALVTEPGPMLEPLRDEAYFARVFLEFGAPTWPNGFDIAPEWLRREMAAGGGPTRGAAEWHAAVQGTPFGIGPAFRVSYATKTEDVEEACRRIEHL